MANSEELINKAYEMYSTLQEQIKQVYRISEEYPIFHAELDEILYNAEEYIHDLFMGIAFAQGTMSPEEQKFIEKLQTLPKSEGLQVDKNNEICSIVSKIPLFIKLASEVDKYTVETKFANEFVNNIRSICKLLQDSDGNTYANESEYMYGVTNNLEKFLKECERKNEK